MYTYTYVYLYLYLSIYIYIYTPYRDRSSHALEHASGGVRRRGADRDAARATKAATARRANRSRPSKILV